jgi:hypothetical protein
MTFPIYGKNNIYVPNHQPDHISPFYQHFCFGLSLHVWLLNPDGLTTDWWLKNNPKNTHNLNQSSRLGWKSTIFRSNPQIWTKITWINQSPNIFSKNKAEKPTQNHHVSWSNHDEITLKSVTSAVLLQSDGFKVTAIRFRIATLQGNPPRRDHFFVYLWKVGWCIDDL